MLRLLAWVSGLTGERTGLQELGWEAADHASEMHCVPHCGGGWWSLVVVLVDWEEALQLATRSNWGCGCGSTICAGM